MKSRRFSKLTYLFILLGLTACGGDEAPANDEALITTKPLRKFADAAGIKIGTAVNQNGFDDDDFFKQVLAHQFNTVVAEHFMGMDVVQQQQGVYKFDRVDKFFKFAASHKMSVRGPTLIYGKDNPKWLDQGTWTKKQLTDIITDHVNTMMKRYKGKVFAWDIVNEPLHYKTGDSSVTFEDNIYTQVFGNNSDYIKIALQAARAADPSVKLFINEFGAEIPGPKYDALYSMVVDFQNKGVPIDGIGYQLHKKDDLADDLTNFTDGVRTTMKAFAALGLEVNVTELDVRIKTPVSSGDKEQQAKVYGALFDLCHSIKACTAFMMWGFTDKYSWIPKFFPGYDEALILDESFAFKPAYDTLLSSVKAAAP